MAKTFSYLPDIGCKGEAYPYNTLVYIVYRDSLDNELTIGFNTLPDTKPDDFNVKDYLTKCDYKGLGDWVRVTYPPIKGV